MREPELQHVLCFRTLLSMWVIKQAAVAGLSWILLTVVQDAPAAICIPDNCFNHKCPWDDLSHTKRLVLSGEKLCKNFIYPIHAWNSDFFSFCTSLKSIWTVSISEVTFSLVIFNSLVSCLQCLFVCWCCIHLSLLALAAVDSSANGGPDDL